MGLFNRVKYDKLDITVFYYERRFDINSISEQLNFFQEAISLHGLDLGSELENNFSANYGNYRQQVEGGGEMSIQYTDVDNSSVIIFSLRFPKLENSNNKNSLNQIFFILTMLLEKWGDNNDAFKYGKKEWKGEFWNLVSDDFRESVGKYIYGDKW
ncbi:MAG: hypothetical protein LBI13_09200 [Streptococcaceae bacterium]|jgi:hypothetical protein|nr:hypothetical protein [Streptococcaceae bacterium]